MHNHFIFQELRDVKNELRLRKEDEINVLYNQMKIGEDLGLTHLRNILLGDFTKVEEIDGFRTTADLDPYGYTTTDGTPKEIITNDFYLNGSFGDYSIFTYKDNINLNVSVFISNETSGENFVELTKTNERNDDALIEETFKISKGLGNRVRIKFIVDKVDDVASGSLFRFNLIYQ